MGHRHLKNGNIMGAVSKKLSSCVAITSTSFSCASCIFSGPIRPSNHAISAPPSVKAPPTNTKKRREKGVTSS